jgi:hypothetical protein
MNNAHHDCYANPYRFQGKPVPPIDHKLFLRMIDVFTESGKSPYPNNLPQQTTNLVDAFPEVPDDTYYAFVERYLAFLKIIRDGQVEVWLSAKHGIHNVVVETAAQCRLIQNSKFDPAEFRRLACRFMAHPKYGFSEEILSALRACDWSKSRTVCP